MPIRIAVSALPGLTVPKRTPPVAHHAAAPAPEPKLAYLPPAKVDILEQRATHDNEVNASRRQAFRRSAVVWLGAMVASGLVGYGLGLAFSGVSGWLNATGVINDPKFHETLKRVFDPTLFAVVGMFTAGVASFFNENITGPLRPLTTRWVMSASPEKVKLDKDVQRELIHSWQAEQTVDARVLAGRWNVTEMCMAWKLTFREVARAMRAGDIEGAAAFLGGDLIASETLWFWVVPSSDAIFDLVRKPIAPYLRDVSDADLVRLKEATLAYVRKNRREIADPARLGIDDALSEYYAPVVDQLFTRAPRAA